MAYAASSSTAALVKPYATIAMCEEPKLELDKIFPNSTYYSHVCTWNIPNLRGATDVVMDDGAMHCRHAIHAMIAVVCQLGVPLATVSLDWNIGGDFPIIYASDAICYGDGNTTFQYLDTKHRKASQYMERSKTTSFYCIQDPREKHWISMSLGNVDRSSYSNLRYSVDHSGKVPRTKLSQRGLQVLHSSFPDAVDWMYLLLMHSNKTVYVILDGLMPESEWRRQLQLLPPTNSMELMCNAYVSGDSVTVDKLNDSSVLFIGKRTPLLQDPFVLHFQRWKRVCWFSQDVHACIAENPLAIVFPLNANLRDILNRFPNPSSFAQRKPVGARITDQDNATTDILLDRPLLAENRGILFHIDVLFDDGKYDSMIHREWCNCSICIGEYRKTHPYRVEEQDQCDDEEEDYDD